MKYELATSSWGKEEFLSVQNVLYENKTTMSDKTRIFEQEFASYVGSKYAVMVNSGSSANLLMTAALVYHSKFSLKKGDEVIVPAVSWATTYYPLYQYGLKLKFVDIDLMTLNYDLTALKKAITEKTRCIMCVNLLGNPNEFDTIKKLTEQKNIILIEDNCESLGATYKGKHAGTFGIMGTFSTFFSHHMSTMEGGLIVTDDEECYHLLLCLRAHGWTRNLPKENKVCSTKSDNPFYEMFRFVLPGYNVRPLEMESAIGSEQLKKIPEFISWRKKNAIFFQHCFANNTSFYLQKEIESSSWFGFSLIIKPECTIKRDELITYLMQHNIECRPIVTGNFTKNEVLRYFDYELAGEMKNAEYLDKNGFFVGNHQFDIQDKIEYLLKTIQNY